MRRTGALIAVVVSVAAMLVACDTHGPRQRLGRPSLPVQFGLRVTDGQLRIWTGSPCQDVTWVSLRFTDDARFVWQPPPGEVADVEYLVVNGANPGLDVVETPPQGFTLQNAEFADLTVYAARDELPSRVRIADVVTGSRDHPDDTYYFGAAGWLNAAEVAAQDGETFLAPCSEDPDPAEGQLLPQLQFGVRVTDGRLRLWSGRCRDVYSVAVIFTPDRSQPGQVETEMLGTGPSDFTELTVGEPVPGLDVRKPLPADYDWRTARGLTLTIRKDTIPHGSHITSLDEVFARSERYPPDTFWFEGVGWLDAEQIARFDGERFYGLCPF